MIGDATRSTAVRRALETDDWRSVFSERECSALEYAGKLTRHPAEISGAEIESLRRTGWDDPEILEINQVTAYFNYANRTVLGLGVDTNGDILGLSPGNADDSTDWRHH